MTGSICLFTMGLRWSDVFSNSYYTRSMLFLYQYSVVFHKLNVGKYSFMFILCDYPLMTGLQNTAPSIFYLTVTIVKPYATYFPVQN